LKKEIKMTDRDYKILDAMIGNLESFLVDADAAAKRLPEACVVQVEITAVKNPVQADQK
jgi:hypothetical protein